MGTPSLGVASQMAIDSALPFDTSSLPIEFISENLAKQGVILETDGIRGTRSHPAERTRTGPYKVSGSVTCAVDAIFLDRFLPYILGAAEATDVFAVAETLPEFYLMVDRGAKVFTYAGCRVGKAVFSASAGGILMCTMDIEAETETVSVAGGFPVLTHVTNRPYVFSDGVFTLNSTARDTMELEITVDNGLDADRFVNELSRSQIPSTDRLVSVRTKHPYTSDETSLYDLAIGSFGAYSLLFTNAEEASTTLTVACPKVQYPARSPVVGGKGEIYLELEGMARKSGSTSEITFTSAHA